MSSFWLLFPVARFGVVTDEQLDETPTISPDCFGCDMEMVPEARQPVPDGVSPTGRYRSVSYLVGLAYQFEREETEC